MAGRRGREFVGGTSLVWAGENFIEKVLRAHGRGIGTVVGDGEKVLEFDISVDGRFGMEPGQDPLVCAKLFGMFGGGSPVAVTLRTFTSETVSVRHGTDKDRLIRVPVKELRGYRVFISGREPGKIRLDFEKVPPEVLRECYSYDAKTGEYTGLQVDERDHVFV